MDEMVFRSSQRLERLQMQVNIAALNGRELLRQYSDQGRAAVRQMWGSSYTEHARDRFWEFWAYVVAMNRELKARVMLYADPRMFYNALARVFWRRWSKREFCFFAAGFILGTATGVVVTLSMRKKRSIQRYMRAVQCSHYLGIESAAVVETAPAPVDCGSDEVTINVKAASVQVVDAQICNGYGRTLRRILRNLYQGQNFELPVTLGRDCSGIVTDVGQNVQRLEVGDEVWAVVPFWHDGTLSQSVVLPADRVGRKPKNAGFEGACSLPYAGCLALSTLKNAGVSQDNATHKRILVHGGCTPTGCALIQILRHWNADVTVTCYKRAVPVAKALGAPDVVVLPDPRANAAEVEAEQRIGPLDDDGDDDPPTIEEGAQVTGDARAAFRKELELKEQFDVVLMTRSTEVPSGWIGACRKPDGGVAVSTLPPALASDSCGFVGSLVLGGYIRLKYYLEKALGAGLNDYDEAHFCHVPLDEIAELVESGHLQTVVDKVFHAPDIEMALSHIQSPDSIGSTVVTFR